jgi:hypothetical protein
VFMKINVPNISSAEITVCDALGKTVLAKNTVTTDNDIKLDMNNKPNGMYLLQMKTSEGTITKKFVISK